MTPKEVSSRFQNAPLLRIVPQEVADLRSGAVARKEIVADVSVQMAAAFLEQPARLVGRRRQLVACRRVLRRRPRVARRVVDGELLGDLDEPLELVATGDAAAAGDVAALPDERPALAAGDAFAMPVGLRRAVNLRAGGNHLRDRLRRALRRRHVGGEHGPRRQC